VSRALGLPREGLGGFCEGRRRSAGATTKTSRVQGQFAEYDFATTPMSSGSHTRPVICRKVRRACYKPLVVPHACACDWRTGDITKSAPAHQFENQEHSRQNPDDQFIVFVLRQMSRKMVLLAYFHRAIRRRFSSFRPNSEETGRKPERTERVTVAVP
jgi:hypothetical protein